MMVYQAILPIPFSYVLYLVIYLLGGLTLLPGILISIWYFSPTSSSAPTKKQQSQPATSAQQDEKNGWIRLIENQHQPSGGMMFSGSTSHKTKPGNSDRLSGLKSSVAPSSSSSCFYYAILRHGTLFCFDNEKEKTCHVIVPIHDYQVSLYPTSCLNHENNNNSNKKPRESELYGRIMSICLTPKNTHAITYYLTCQRAFDKEDWYFALLAAARFLDDDNVDEPWQPIDWRDSTMYDQAAMTTLEKQLAMTNNNNNNNDNTTTTTTDQPSWWHALMGRLFLGIYKTDAWRMLWHEKLKTKLDKLNTQLAQQQQQSEDKEEGEGDGLLELEQIHMGETIPWMTSMALDTFDADGQCVISGQFQYDGDLWAVIRMDVWSLWPFHHGNSNNNNKQGGGVVWTIKLRHCSGKMIFKVKPPPSNRIWVAFASMPSLDLKVTPMVGDKQIKWSMVTHLIEAKIKDMIMDTLVMPNMEDVPFFDSGGQGGIFGERRPPPPPAAAAATNDDDDDDDDGVDANNEKQQLPKVSKLVQGYISRIKVSHKMTPSFSTAQHPGSPKTTKV